MFWITFYCMFWIRIVVARELCGRLSRAEFPDLWASLVSPSRVCRFTICILSFVIWVASAAFKWLPQMILTTGGG